MYKLSESLIEAEAKKLVYEAYELIKVALEVQDNNWAVHKWMSILLDAKSGYEGTKERIKQLYNVKQHMLVRIIIIIAFTQI